jgi:hypothetical protein
MTKKVYAQATVVKTQKVFWTELKSAPITLEPKGDAESEGSSASAPIAAVAFVLVTLAAKAIL